MQVQVNIAFEQLVKIVRALPPSQLKKLKVEIEAQHPRPETDLETMLLNGPTATKKQLEIIAGNRKAINQWRTIQ